MTFTLLWTDSIIYVIVLALGYLLFFNRGNLQWALILQKVFSRPPYIVSLMILMLFGLIGLLDTIHFKVPNSNHRIVSSLDLIFSPRTWQNEVTYSAPFALRSYAPEIVKLPDGKIEEVYPRLEYAGQHLDSDSSKIRDILGRSLKGLLLGILMAGFLFFIVDRFLTKQVQPFLRSDQNSLKQFKCVFWSTLTVIFCLISISGFLMFEYHILGTDKVGRDVFCMALKSIRTGLVIGTLTTLVSLPFALVLGMWAGYFRGIIDDLVQYVYVTLSSIPGILLIAAAVLSLQVKIEQDPDLKLLVLCLILGITSWTSLCRLLRGETLKLREAEFIQAARALGVGQIKSIWRHILPNLLHIVIIVLVLDFSGLVLAEAVLTYVGVGVDPSTHSWGNMINAARLEMARDPIVWWSLTGAFCLMFALVFSANIFSEAVQDALNPRSD